MKKLTSEQLNEMAAYHNWHRLEYNAAGGLMAQKTAQQDDAFGWELVSDEKNKRVFGTFPIIC